MHTRETETSGVAAAAKEVVGHAGSIARLELRLAAAELKEKVAALGMGIGLAVGAAIFTVLTLGLAAATIAAALATALPTWLALLIVTAGAAATAAGLGALALGAVRRGTPPVPEQAIEEAKLTTEAVRGNGSQR